MREPALKAQRAHPGVCPVQPALDFPGLPDADISSHLRRFNRFSQSTGMKNKERKGEEKEREEFVFSPQILKPLSLMNVQGSGGVTSPGAAG